MTVFLAVLAAALPGLPGKVDRYWDRQLVDSYQVLQCGPRACRVRVRIPRFEQVLICRWYRRPPHLRCVAVRTLRHGSPRPSGRGLLCVSGADERGACSHRLRNERLQLYVSGRRALFGQVERERLFEALAKLL
jgi:hypothetical protein